MVRDWSLDDVADLAHNANDRAVWLNLTDSFPHPYGEQDAREWLSWLFSRDLPTHWAIECGGIAVGGIGVVLGEDVFSKTGELGYWLGRDYWGQGIMTDAVAHVAPYVMEDFGLRRLQASVYEWNHASMRVLEKNGFVLEGIARANVFKDGQVIDESVYALVKG